MNSLDGTDSETITVNITGANDNATITVTTGGDYAVLEAGGVANGTLGDPNAAGDLNVADVDDGEAVFQAVAPASLVGTYGDFTFVAATGAWTYTLNDNDGDTQALNTTDVGITDTLTVTSLDGTDSETITVSVSGANDAPTDLTFTGGTVAENSPNGTVVASVATVTDVDNSSGFTYSLQDTAGGRFAINASGVITVANGGLLDYETNTSKTVTVRVTDAGGLSYDENLLISVTDVVENQAPTDINLSTTTVQENSLNVLLGTLSTVDPDDVSGFTYTLTDNAGGRFELLNGNEIHVARGDLLDYEVATSHQITVQVVDTGGASYTETITINLTDMTSVSTFTDPNPPAADVVDGTGGVDNLDGGGLNDRLYGGEGNDNLSGGAGADALYGQGGVDTLNGDQDADIVLDGGAGNDILNGGTGNDILVGGIGADIMNGGTGADRFIWRAEDVGTDVDQINAFASGDILQVGDVLTGYSGVGSTLGFVQVISGGGPGNVLVQVDANGGGDSWTTLVQVNTTTVAAVTSALDFTTFTRTDYIG